MPLKDKEAYNAYMNEYMKKRYTRRRAEAIEQLGGVCVDCGEDENLDLHHLDPSKKSFTIARGSSFSEKRWQEELNKCVLKCKECHIDEHRHN